MVIGGAISAGRSLLQTSQMIFIDNNNRCNAFMFSQSPQIDGDVALRGAGSLRGSREVATPCLPPSTLNRRRQVTWEGHVVDHRVTCSGNETSHKHSNVAFMSATSVDAAVDEVVTTTHIILLRSGITITALSLRCYKEHDCKV